MTAPLLTPGWCLGSPPQGPHYVEAVDPDPDTPALCEPCRLRLEREGHGG